jgi:hypothetical protein
VLAKNSPHCHSPSPPAQQRARYSAPGMPPITLRPPSPCVGKDTPANSEGAGTRRDHNSRQGWRAEPGSKRPVARCHGTNAGLVRSAIGRAIHRGFCRHAAPTLPLTHNPRTFPLPWSLPPWEGVDGKRAHVKSREQGSWLAGGMHIAHGGDAIENRAGVSRQPPFYLAALVLRQLVGWKQAVV